MTAFRLNGTAALFDDGERDTPLLYVLRSKAVGDMTPKLGCGREECGACRVLVDGKPTYACTFPAGAVEGRHVQTAAGLDTPVRRALNESNATQW